MEDLELEKTNSSISININRLPLKDILVLIVLGGFLPMADTISDILTAIKLSQIRLKVGLALFCPVLLNIFLTLSKWWKHEGKS